MNELQKSREADISRDEILFRLLAVSDSLGTYQYLKNHSFCECEQCESEAGFFTDLRVKLKGTVLQYILVQFSSLFDQSGRYSFKINNGLINENRIKKLFPELSAVEITSITESINKIISNPKNQKLIKELIKIRGEYVAHINSRRAEHINDWDEIVNYHELMIPRHLHLGNMRKLCKEIEQVLLNF